MSTRSPPTPVRASTRRVPCLVLAILLLLATPGLAQAAGQSGDIDDPEVPAITPPVPGVDAAGAVEPAARGLMVEVFGPEAPDRVPQELWDQLVATGQDMAAGYGPGLSGQDPAAAVHAIAEAYLAGAEDPRLDQISPEGLGALTLQIAALSAALVPRGYPHVEEHVEDPMPGVPGVPGVPVHTGDETDGGQGAVCQVLDQAGLEVPALDIPGALLPPEARPGDPGCYLSLVGALIGVVLAVAGLVVTAALLGLSQAQETPLPMVDEDGDGVGDVYAEAYAIAEPVLDPDRDRGQSLTEFQWDTIPVSSVETENGLEIYENARDKDGDGWIDGDEIAHWSRFIEKVLHHRVARELGFEQPVTWASVVETLNNQTGLAWRHPGLYLDNDGDGLINVKDPDADNDGLMDGHTRTWQWNGTRHDCFADGGLPWETCDPYEPHALVHHDHDQGRTFPGEITLGTYPAYTDSDCLATLPGSGLPIRCTPSHTRGWQGQPGHGDAFDDAEEYRYWRNLTEDPRYQALYPDVSEPWTVGYDNDRVDNALLDADSDNDGLLDAEEVLGCRVNAEGDCVGQNATSEPWLADTDGDGLSDWEEDQLGTDPRDWDTDGDQLPDGWEVWYGLDPLSLDDGEADEDPDGDGLTNLEEYCQAAKRSCSFDGSHDWKANWCGPNPNLNDTDEDGHEDGEHPTKSYDCTAPSKILNDDPSTDPWAEPNQDLGTLDPESEHWLATGQYARKATSDPVSFANRTLTDPAQVAKEITENLTRDTQVLSRMLLPPEVWHTAWPMMDEVDRTVEHLVDCLPEAPLTVPPGTDDLLGTLPGSPLDPQPSDWAPVLPSPGPGILPGVPEDRDPLTLLPQPPEPEDPVQVDPGDPWALPPDPPRPGERIQMDPRDPTSIQVQPPGQAEEGLQEVQLELEDAQAEVEELAEPTTCLLGHLQSQADEALPVALDPLLTDAIDPLTTLEGHVGPLPIETTGADELQALDLPTSAPLGIDVPALVNETVDLGDLEDEVLDPVLADPWSLLAEPDAFPNVLSDATTYHGVTELFDLLAAVDQATGAPFLPAADGTHWDLVLETEDGERIQRQNIPIGTPTPILLDEDCLEDALTTALKTTIGCAGEAVEPDLVVQVTPRATLNGELGYTFAYTQRATGPLALGLTALVQVPDRDRVLSLSLDGRPQAGERISPGVTVGPLPSQASLTASVNHSDPGQLDLELEQLGGQAPLVVRGGLFAVDVHDPDKPGLEHPRTEASALLWEPPALLSLQVDQDQDGAQDRLSTTWTTSQATRVAAALHHRGQGTELAGTLLLDPLPPEGTVVYETTDTRTQITQQHAGSPEGDLDLVQLRGWTRPWQGDQPGPRTILDLALEGVPATTSLTLEDLQATTLTYEASGPLDRARATIHKPGATCTVLPTDNDLVVTPACTHVDLHGLQNATATLDDGLLEATWTRDRGTGNLGVVVDEDEHVLRTRASAWPAEGSLELGWPEPVTADWTLSAGIDQLTLGYDRGHGGQGHVLLQGLPRQGDLDADLADREIDISLDEPLDLVGIQITPDGTLPAPPTDGDHVLVAATEEGPRVRLQLHDLATSQLSFGASRALVDVETSQGRSLTVQYQDAGGDVHAHVDRSPGPLHLEVDRSSANITLSASHGPGPHPTLTAAGTLEELGFQLQVPSLPETVDGYVDAGTGNLKLSASSPLSASAVLTGDPGTSPEPIVLDGLATGVSTDLVDALGSLEPGIRVRLDGLELVRVHRSQSPDGQETVDAIALASRAVPLEVALKDGESTHLAHLDPLPAGQRFETTFGDTGGKLSYEATHLIDELRIASVIEGATSSETFLAWGRAIPTTIDAAWVIPEDLLEGTLTATATHDGSAPVPEIGFQWLQDDEVTGDRTARALAIQDLPDEVTFSLEDRRTGELRLSQPATLPLVAGLFADTMPTDRATLPEAGTHGLHLNTLADGTSSLGFRFQGVRPFEEMKLPTPGQPSLDVDVTLNQALPLDLHIEDDQPPALEVDLALDRFGGGASSFTGLLDVLAEDPTVDLAAELAEPFGQATLAFRNATAWLDAELTGQARSLALAYDLPALELTANEPIDVVLHTAPLEEDEAPGMDEATGTSYIKADLTGLTRAGVDLQGLTSLQIAPDHSGQLGWEAIEPQELMVSYLNATTQLETLRLDTLPHRGTADWSTTGGGFEATLDLPAASRISRIDLNLTRSPAGEGDTHVEAHLTGWRGPGSLAFVPDERAFLDVPGGIGAVHGQVLTGPDGYQRLDVLDDQHGLVFDEPEAGSYEQAVVFNISQPRVLDVTITPSGAGGMWIEGGLHLRRAVQESLFLRGHSQGDWVNATASNLPLETSFSLDTRREARGEGADEVGEDDHLNLEIDWHGHEVREMSGSFSAVSDGAPASSVDGNFTLRGVSSVLLEMRGGMEEDLDLTVGGEIDRAYVLVNQDDRRLRIAPQGISGTYLAQVQDKGEQGVMMLLEGDPAEQMRIEFKDGDAPTRTGRTPMYLIATTEDVTTSSDTTARANYTHLKLAEPQKIAWGKLGEDGFTATLRSGGTGADTLVDYWNATDRASFIAAGLPERVNVNLTTEPGFLLETKVSDPVDLEALSYERVTDNGTGVLRTDGLPVEVGISGVLQGVQDTLLEIDRDDDGQSTVTVETEGIEVLRLHGVLRGEGDEDGEGKHILSQLAAVPPTTLTFTAQEERPPDPVGRNPYVELKTQAPIGRLSTAITLPVTEEPAALAWPDDGYGQLVSIEDTLNDTVEEQRIIGVNLTAVEGMHLLHGGWIDRCNNCSPVQVSLDRAVPSLPLFVFLNTTFGNTSVEGHIGVDDVPASTVLQVGHAKETADQSRALGLTHRGDGPMADIDADIELHTANGTDRIQATVDRVPPELRVVYQQSPLPGHQGDVCGLPVTTATPGRVILDTGTTRQGVEGLDLKMGAGGPQHLSSADGDDFLGIEVGQDGRHMVLQAAHIVEIAAELDPATNNGTAEVLAELGDNRDLRVQFADSEQDRHLNLALDGGSWPLRISCQDQRIDVQSGNPGDPGRVEMDRVSVTASGWELLGREADVLRAQMEDLQGAVQVSLKPVHYENGAFWGKGFRVAGSDGASIGSLDIQANLEPPSQQEIQECLDETHVEEAFQPLELAWGVPVDSALIDISTVPGQHSGLPLTPNRARWTDRCDEATLFVDLRDLDALHFKRDITKVGERTEFSVEVGSQASTTIQMYDYDDGGDEADHRLQFVGLDGGLEIVYRPEATRLHYVKEDIPKLWIRNSVTLERFSYHRNGCAEIWAEELEARPFASHQLVGFEAIARAATCELRNTDWGGLAKGAVKKLGLRVSNGFTEAIDGVITFPAIRIDSEVSGKHQPLGGASKGDLLFEWDLDGLNESREKPKILRVKGAVEGLRLDIVDTANQTGSSVNLEKLQEEGGANINILAAWEDSSHPGTPPDAKLYGSLEPPRHLMKKKCLSKDHEGRCVYETLEQVRERVAETYLDDGIHTKNGGSHAVSEVLWEDVLR